MIFDELANMLHHVGNQIMLDTCTIFYIQYCIDGMVQNCYILIFFIKSHCYKFRISILTDKNKCMPLKNILEFIVAFDINIVTIFHSLPKTNFQIFHNVRQLVHDVWFRLPALPMKRLSFDTALLVVVELFLFCFAIWYVKFKQVKR